MPRKKKAEAPADVNPGAVPLPKPRSRRGRKKDKPEAPPVAEDPAPGGPGCAAEVALLDRLRGPGDYQGRPVEYCKDVLGVGLTPMQARIFGLAQTPPYRVLCGCGVGVGKSFWAACFINYRFDNYVPSLTLSTAPTTREIRDVIWGHVRELRYKAGLGGMVGNVSPELRGTHPKHYAKGYAAEREESFQGRHEHYMAFLFDEATGIPKQFWDSTKGMFKPVPEHVWVAFFNPIDVSAHVYREWTRAEWHKIQMGCHDHPNVLAGLAGTPEPFPGTVSREQFELILKEDAEEVEPGKGEGTDIWWPPLEYSTADNPSKCYRPGPYMESRFLGRWPSGDLFGVWSRHAWNCAMTPLLWKPTASLLPQMGCDVAGHGANFTVIHTRWGPQSIAHERHNGWTKTAIADRLKYRCEELAAAVNELRPKDAPKIAPEEIPVKIDADGMGVDVVDLAGGFSFIPCCGSGTAQRVDKYQNKRAEAWFEVCQSAKDFRLSVSRLHHDALKKLEDQLLAPQWKTNPQTGKVQLEDKAETEKRLGCSPDDADAFTLAYCTHGTIASRAWEIMAEESGWVDDVPRKPWEPPTTRPAPGGGPGYPVVSEPQEYEQPRRYWRFGYNS